MTIKFGTWDAKYALGEKLFVADMKRKDYTDEDINNEIEYYKTGGTPINHQRRAEIFVELLGISAGAGGSNALFGPIERSKENTDRMHAITLSMGADTGKRELSQYNAAIVPIYALQNPDGSYVLPSGGRTNDSEKARVYTDRSEAESHCLSRQTIVEV